VVHEPHEARAAAGSRPLQHLLVAVRVAEGEHRPPPDEAVDDDGLAGSVVHELDPGKLRQLTGDSGSGAVLGPFKGKVDAIGPGLIYTTLLGTTPFILNVRHYREFNVENRWEGHSTIFSGTIRF
jgi:hypothetical protein